MKITNDPGLGILPNPAPRPSLAVPAQDSLSGKKRLAFLIAGLVFGFGLIDIFLRWRMAGVNGLHLALFDPGKVLFHQILLPLIAYLQIRWWPSNAIRLALQVRRPYFIGAAGLLTMGVFSATAWDFQQGFKDRRPSPEDVSTAAIRDTLLLLRMQGIHEKLRDSVKWNGRYEEVVDTKFRKNYRVHLSYRAYYSSFLTFLGLAGAGVLLILLGTYFMLRMKPSQKIDLAILAIITLFSFWFPARAFSEWHIHFGTVNVLKIYNPLWIGMIVFPIAVIVFIMLRQKNRIEAITLAILSAASLIVPTTEFLGIPWLDTAASSISTFNWLGILILYILATFFSILAFASVTYDPDQRLKIRKRRLNAR